MDPVIPHPNLQPSFLEAVGTLLLVIVVIALVARAQGGDELNRLVRGANYGYPIVSDGDHYDGREMPDHDTHPEFNAPAVSWTPVVSPGDLMIYRGKLFADWRGNSFVAGLSSRAIVRIELDGKNASEVERYDMGARIRSVVEGPDGAIWVLEDDDGDSTGRLLKLTPKD